MAVYVDGTLALGGRPWVRNHIRRRRSRDLLAEWMVKLISVEEYRAKLENDVVGRGGWLVTPNKAKFRFAW
jgi:hypothetical protein